MAYYIVLQRNLPGFDHRVNGKALARASELLEGLAREASVESLMDFFGAPRQELAEFAEDHGIDFNQEAIEVPAKRWFSPDDGLRTVSALTDAVKNRKPEHAEEILRDLQDFRRVLEAARTNGIGWYLAVDY